MSSEAETQQPPAAPPAAPALSAADTKPGTTGSGAGSGGPGGLTSAAPAGGDKKVIGENRTWTGVGQVGKSGGGTVTRSGASRRARGRRGPSRRRAAAPPPGPPTRALADAGPPGPRARQARARAASRAPCGPRAAARPSPCAAARRRPRVRRGPSPPCPPAACARARTPLFRPPPAPFRVYPEGAARRLRRPEWAGRLPPSHVLAVSRGPRAHPARARALGLTRGLCCGGFTHVDRADGRQALGKKAVRWPWVFARECVSHRMLKRGGFEKGRLVIVGFFFPLSFSNEGFGNSKMVQCKKRIWFHQQVR